ncbi:hypothetical protein TorRG33x02_117370 [Trema orientale]|uniref:Uncharacterized protein n=1 Tax=Trema orientale TaxID=63057 RepID=A0A2P5F3P8_TREOI|nr:hypothetical protein TorRG33x02_117370 [Trema orientale]
MNRTKNTKDVVEVRTRTNLSIWVFFIVVKTSDCNQNPDRDNCNREGLAHSWSLRLTGGYGISVSLRDQKSKERNGKHGLIFIHDKK